ncbi:dopamine receptor 2-like [Artemia franciscana]|uniref:G-protein coupled receptors family 1 profile domain-containing protein n=1 Tax=Artemia franciscana TaxID=6661 RepID=A0AA88HY14_ARTSF|nr:hypothetical protein QYM36_011068 [Artemia franciscana]KAK2712253.1 hypothetical protein QYM36_011068 [Artemia franciscana]KAK2712254.1 hypothetical protein QYM36_011068 [Artemia franciscana]
MDYDTYESFLVSLENYTYNNKSHQNETLHMDYEILYKYENVILAVILSFFCIATVFGNMLVICAVYREYYLHTVTNYFIVSLAVADCLVGGVVMPFSAAHEALDKQWPFGQAWCDVWHSCDVLASTASILNLCVISLDRYWAITDPFTYPSKMNNKKAYSLIAIVWICSSLISFPAILWWRAVSPVSGPYECLFTDDIGYLLFSSIISFYAPLIVMVFTYLRIYRAAVAQTRSIKNGIKAVVEEGSHLTLRMHRGGPPRSHSSCPNSRIFQQVPPTFSILGNGQPTTCKSVPTTPPDDFDFVCGRNGFETSHPLDRQLQCDSCQSLSNKTTIKANFNLSRKFAKMAKEKKAAKTLAIVMGVFIACWLPFFVTNLLSGICYGCIRDPEIVFPIVTWLGWVNSGMNPVIYASMSRDFRRAFGRILCGCFNFACERKRPSTVYRTQCRGDHPGAVREWSSSGEGR